MNNPVTTAELTTRHKNVAFRVVEIRRLRQSINIALSDLESEISRLPNSVPDLDPEHAIEWHEQLRALQTIVSVGKASWSSAEHHVFNTMSSLTKSLNLDSSDA